MLRRVADGTAGSEEGDDGDGAGGTLGGGGKRLAGPPSSGACIGARNGLPVATAAFVSVPLDERASLSGSDVRSGFEPRSTGTSESTLATGVSRCSAKASGFGGGNDEARRTGAGGGVPEPRGIGGKGGGPFDARAIGAIGIGGIGRIDVGCDGVRAGGGGGTRGGGEGNAEVMPGDIPAGGVGQPVRVERETGATSAAPETAGGEGGTSGLEGDFSGTAAASELSVPGGSDQPLPFTRSSKTCKSSPPLPSDIEATPCSSRGRARALGPTRRAIFPNAGPVGQVLLQLSKGRICPEWPERPKVGRNSVENLDVGAKAPNRAGPRALGFRRPVRAIFGRCTTPW